jgi:DNA-binding NarL/FixJ family response regulator
MNQRARTAIQIVIVQHDALLRDLLGAALRQGSGIEVIGSFADGSALVREAAELAPDVVVLDVDPAGNNGVPLALRLQRVLPEVGIVLLVDRRDAALLASVSGDGLLNWSYVVNKGTQGLTTLQRAIQVTHARLLDIGGAARERPETGTKRGPHLPALTERQRTVLALLVQGFSNGAIARALGIKEKSVENQLATIYAKLYPNADRTEVHPRVWVALHYARALAASEASASG